jgi:preprotein translocase subunit YajC
MSRSAKERTRPFGTMRQLSKVTNANARRVVRHARSKDEQERNPMTEKEARKLKVGDRVVFSDGVTGIVEQVGYSAAQFRWEDGQCGVIHNDDMQDVARATDGCSDD